ncbi:pilus assembly protein TadG-related protein [Catenuloplanes sp. NPDC051500]|uniref:pilus assembly protein TadG-related protein n=1 Tax=Catenuloplanes sp. NPDC051500 TaxID=3363959 RepID=UPI0037B96E50
MPRLTGRRPRRRDRGAVAVLVAMMMTSGMVFGFGALTVDVGLLYAERAQLQSAADAAAIAVAKVCALHLPECNGDDMVVESRRYAEWNVKNAAVAISEICGKVVRRPGAPTAHLPIRKCTRTETNLTGCLGDESEYSEYIEVRVRTDRPGDSTALPPVFAGAVTGTDGVTVGACARASWRAISTVEDALPIVVSDCVARRALEQPEPSGGDHRADERAELALPFREIGEDGEYFGFCRDPGWKRLPGERPGDATDGFGGEVLNTGCVTEFTIGTVRSLTGTAGGNEEMFWEHCFARLVELAEEKTPVPVAVYSPADGDRASIVSVRTFVVTGWHKDDWPAVKPAAPKPEDRWDVQPRYADCPTEAVSCLFGYFTADPAGGGAAGPSSIRITG